MGYTLRISPALNTGKQAFYAGTVAAHPVLHAIHCTWLVVNDMFAVLEDPIAGGIFSKLWHQIFRTGEDEYIRLFSISILR